MEKVIDKSVENTVAGYNAAIGNDLVFVPNFILSFTDQFKQKVYTSAETAYCEQFADAMLRYASTWAAKEAVYKAVKQLNDAALGWNKIEIVRKKNVGQPMATIHSYPNNYKISLTISHDGDYVWAIALVQNS